MMWRLKAPERTSSGNNQNSDVFQQTQTFSGNALITTRPPWELCLPPKNENQVEGSPLEKIQEMKAQVSTKT